MLYNLFDFLRFDSSMLQAEEKSKKKKKGKKKIEGTLTESAD
jgi:hypothetical protein